MAYRIKQMSLQLQTTHLERSVQFYIEALSFEVEFRYEDFYAGIVKDNYSIHLKMTDHPTPATKHDDDAPLAVLFSVGNIESLYEELSAKEVVFAQPLRQMPYGKEFYVADPDGNILSFVEPAE